MKNLSLSLLIASAMSISACQKNNSITKALGFDNSGDSSTLSVPADPAQAELGGIRPSYAEGELTRICMASIDLVDAKLKSIVTNAATGVQVNKDLENPLLAYETVMADLSDMTSPLTFMSSVSSNSKTVEESLDCQTQVSKLTNDIMTRKDLFKVLKDSPANTDEEKRLYKMTISGFEANGLNLPDDQLALVKKLNDQLSQLQTDFGNALSADKTVVMATAEELAGLSDDYIKSLKRDNQGLLIVPTDESAQYYVATHSSREDFRKKFSTAVYNRGGLDNVKRLEQAIEIRHQIASIMGFSSWANYRVMNRMAPDAATVNQFLATLADQLKNKNADDLNNLLKYKKEIDPQASKLNSWDVTYMRYQLKKRDYSLDQDQISEYFPAELVIAGLFQAYSQMFGVDYIEMKDAQVWAPDVKFYKIVDKKDGRLMGGFYTDFYPRENKYDHAAAFPLLSARKIVGNIYSMPVAAIVANVTPAIGDKPALFGHEDVLTIFHEFGHIMHQTLSRAPYASLSGANVAQDFVEAPSQMLENWTWSPEILSMISGHYLDHSKKLPQDLLEKMLAARDFQIASYYTKQILYASFDMLIHSSGPKVDTTKVYNDLYSKIIGIEVNPDEHFAASFGHLMGGYDAGYYGYLWSLVYADDMFTKFEEGGLLSPDVGGRYRKVILEQGNMKDAFDLLTEFLGRAPNNKAFLKRLHIE